MTPTEEHPSSSAAIASRVRERIDELRTPRTTKARQWVHELGVDHLVRREVTVTLPPLLEQLARSMAGSTSGRGSSGTQSRPPGSLEGTDTLRTITIEARYLWSDPGDVRGRGGARAAGQHPAAAGG